MEYPTVFTFPVSDDVKYKDYMQYTGLKDKNGKEIYEGDTIQAEGGNPNTVLWWEEKGLWGVDEKDTYYDYLFEHYKEHEIIGNIYENPELIK